MVARLWPVLLYAGLALLFTYPLALHFGGALVGQGDDVLQGYWNMWWARQAALAQGHNPFETPLMHHPFGLSLYFHTHNLLNSLLTLPVQVCCGIPAAFNLAALLAFTLAGCGAYALTYYLTGVRPAALLAGLVYAFSPYMVLPLSFGHLHLLSTHWLPFYMLALLYGLRERRAVLPLAALLLFLIGLTDWHYTLYGILLTLLVGVAEALRRQGWRARALLLAQLAAVGALFTLLMSPIVVPAVLELLDDPHAARELWHSRLHSADLLAFFLPSVFHPLWGAAVGELFYGRLTPSYVVGGIVMLGYVPLALALLGALRDWRRAGLCVLVFAAVFVLALGPHLKVGGINTYDTALPVPLPYLALHQLPLMNVHRAPSRFFVGVLLALAVLAGLGVAWLWQHPAVRRWSAWRRGALVGALALLVLFEYWPRPFPLTALAAQPVPPFYRQVGAAPEAGAILQLPYPADMSLFWQTFHGRPTLGGAISRTPPHPWEGARFFGPLLAVDDAALLQTVGRADTPDDVRAALACQGVRYVVIYKNEDFWLDDPASLPRLERALFAGRAPFYEDAAMRVYALEAAQQAAPYWTLAPRQWYDGQANEQGVYYRWARGEQGALLLYPCGQQRATVDLTLFGFAAPRTIQATWNGQPVGDIALPPGTLRRVRLLLPLREGENRLQFRSLEPATSAAAEGFADDARLLSFNISQVEVRGDRQ